MRHVIARVLAPLLIAGLIAGLVPGVAHAGSASKKDPDDTESRLDLARVTVKTQGRKIVGTITTHDAFANADLSSGSALGIDFRLGKGKVRGIAVRATNDRIRANICTYTRQAVEGRACTRVTVKRLSATSVRVTVPRAKVIKGAKSYRWRGGSFALSGMSGCSTSPFCMDTMVTNPKKWFKLKG